MTATESPPLAQIRLLAGARATPGRSRLDTHLEIHGPLPSGLHDRRWPDRFTETVERSGLLGRGGAAFPTARKMATVRAMRRRPIVVANLMESEPASSKDRVLASAVPHLVLDGAEVLARAIDAVGVRVCVPAEFVESGLSVELALEERRAAGLAATPTNLERPPNHYVGSEESALVRWLDGGESRPVFRASRPAVPRLGGRPALVQNAETLAHLGLIARHGDAWFRSVGRPDAPGTTLLTTSGALRRAGVIEVPLGTRLSDVLAGGQPSQSLAGVLLGGYGGTFVGPEDFDVLLAPEPLSAIGAHLGTGVVVALPAQGCPLAETARIARWMAGESAGQCGPCVFGLPALADDLADLVAGRQATEAARRLAFRFVEVEGRGACRHPDGVVRLVRSALAVFAKDVERHVLQGPCPGVGAPSVLPFPPRRDLPWR